VEIGRASLKGDVGILAVPAKTLNAMRTVAMMNATGQPLLPGRVSLFEEGTFRGFSDLKYAAEGESCVLALGIADGVKLSRTLDRKRSAIVRGERNRIDAAFVITVENLSDRAVSVRLLDRVPVSQSKDIRVSGLALAPAVQPDPKGLVEWKMALGPREKRTVEQAYRIEYPFDYTSFDDAGNRQIGGAVDISWESAAGENDSEVREQIINLEQTF
jgi:uncharacterized protein (TIGR02231 family)